VGRKALADSVSAYRSAHHPYGSAGGGTPDRGVGHIATRVGSLERSRAAISRGRGTRSPEASTPAGIRGAFARFVEVPSPARLERTEEAIPSGSSFVLGHSP